jgi:hypothetical protein
MLKNPYNPTGAAWQTNHIMSCRVSQEDFYYFRRKFPFGQPGIIDKVLSTLYKALIDELKRIDSVERIEPTIYNEDRGFVILEQLLERCSFGSDTGRKDIGPRDVVGGAIGVREAVRSPAVVSANTQSVNSGEVSVKAKKKQRRKGVGNVSND